MKNLKRQFPGAFFVEIDNPPVNGLSHAVRRRIVDGLATAQANGRARYVVLVGTSPGFSGGADLREFGTPMEAEEPHLTTVIRMIASSAKPVVAAIHGIALGGGLELAMGCHFRVATQNATIGLPEIKLGLMPGAGGTQLLPRLTDIPTALDMILEGSACRPDRLRHTRFFAATADGSTASDAAAEACRVMESVLACSDPVTDGRCLRVETAGHEQLLVDSLSGAQRQSSHLPALLSCVQAIRASTHMTFEEGLQYERVLFLDLLESPSSLAMRHLFFAERAAGKLAAPQQGKPRSVSSVLMIGNADGNGIAERLKNLLVRAGVAVHEEGEVPVDLRPDLIIDPVSKDVSQSSAAFERVQGYLHPDAVYVLAAEPSLVDSVAHLLPSPDKAVGLYMKEDRGASSILEIVGGSHTADSAMAMLAALGKLMGLPSVFALGGLGPSGPRLLSAFREEAGRLRAGGLAEADLANALAASGYTTGPLLALNHRQSGPASSEALAAVERLNLKLAYTARDIAEQGAVARQDDLDVLCVIGYGFPRHLGGPLFYADHRQHQAN
ncbi:enoyl-CoA hydratase/isomerase family protein [Bordetella sp. BOR01]|uniref:enoyl-CoA hydratase/isomerase family protein n=1 Tax=Bordetella sp. BOR01 TaxID=2854779 RepID=UPI001C477A8F|nr:enoyl-CoA hydratase-related protein [Bordetella sp. BOR01]MBV7481694.1 enoyl-CoA hydratase/isomerase family protein [Bordetella sp. BOR01]